MNHTVNLVPLTFRRRLLIRKRLRQWVIVWILAGFATGSAGIAEYARLLSGRRSLAGLEAQCVPLRETEQATQGMQQQLAVLSNRESLLTTLQRSDRPAQLIGLVGSAAHGSGHTIHVGEFHLSTTRSTATREVTDPQGQKKQIPFDVESRQLHLRGLGIDDLAVARFVSELRETDTFNSVMLKSSVDVPGQATKASLFEVKCEYQ